jgi:RNA polymerase sigma-70 factor (ECF subfamily)
MTLLNETQPVDLGTQAAVTGGGGSAGEQVSRVLAQLQRLPQRQQEILRLKFQGGLSYKQIAEVMGLTVSHVGVLIHTALKSIRAHTEGAEAAGEVNTRVSR